MNKEKVFGFLKSGLGLLCCALVLTLVLAFFGMLVNTSGGRVKKVTADMDANYAEWYGNATVKPLRVSTLGDVNAKLSGYVYMPRGVSASNPAPAVCLTHGYLNSKEYVEPFAIELARRGYVVFCYDQYDHGTSTWDTPAAFQFYVWSAYDAVQFMYHQDYVLKAADGTGMIGVTGHSMGGFSSEIATFFDQMDVLMTATKQKVVATLPMGADFRYVDFYASPYSGGLYTTIAASYGNRSCGALAAEFDEFFFDNSGNGAGTVIKKNYLADTKGLALLGLTGQVSEADNKTFYKVNPLDGVAYTDQASAAAGYGERIIYQVKGDHPYNTWSPEAVGDVCDFYNHAFQYQASLHGVNYTASTKAGSKQVWALKEVFTCLSLFALVGGIIAALSVTSALPVLNLANTDANIALYNKEEEKLAEGEKKPAKKLLGLFISVLSVAAGLFFLVGLLDRDSTILAKLDSYIKYALILVALALVLIGGFALVQKSKENEKAKDILGKAASGLVLVGLLLFALKWVVNDGASVIASGTKWFNAPSVNTIVYWAISSGIMGLIFAVLSFVVAGDDEVNLLDALGLRANIKQVGIAFVKALAVCLLVFLWIFLIGVIFKTDFRVYTYAFKAQMAGIAWKSWLRYVPLFFIFYLCAGMSISAATVGKRGVKADVIAVLIEVLPSALFLLYQYAVLYTTGTAPFPNFALNGILVQGLILTLTFLAVIQRRSLEKTGNVWTGAFFNTLFFTLITISNTTLYNLA